MEASIFRYVSFLAVFFILYLGGSNLLGRLPSKLAARYADLKSNLIAFQTISGNIIIFAYFTIAMWIFTGENYLLPFSSLFIVSIVSVLLVEFLWLMLGDQKAPWAHKITWTGAEFAGLHPIIFWLILLLAFITIVTYPIYVGVQYFGDSFVPETWPRLFLQISLLATFGISILIITPLRLYILISKNVMEGSRSRMFISEMGGSVILLMILSLFFWTIRGSGETISLIGEHFVFSSTVAYVFAVYLICMLVVPYLIGHFRAKHWIAELEDERSEITDKLAKAFLFPDIGKAIDAIDGIEASIQGKLDDLHETPFFQLVENITDPNSQMDPLVLVALEGERKRDPRFIHEKELDVYLDMISECKSALPSKTTDAEKQKTLNDYSKLLELHKKPKSAESSASKPWALAGIGALTVTALNPIISFLLEYVAADFGITS